jgi:hypothetical protein
MTTAPWLNEERPHALVAEPPRIFEYTAPAPERARLVDAVKPFMYADDEVTAAVPPAVAVTRDHEALQRREYRSSTTWRPNVPPEALSSTTSRPIVEASAAQPVICGLRPLQPLPWQPAANVGDAATATRNGTTTAAATAIRNTRNLDMADPQSPLLVGGDEG